MRKKHMIPVSIFTALALGACSNGNTVSPATSEQTTAVQAETTEEVNEEDSDRSISVEEGSETTPVMPSVVGIQNGFIMGYEDNGIYTYKGVPYGTHERFKYATPYDEYGTEDQPTLALTNGSVSPQSNIQTEYSNWAASAAFLTPSESDMFSVESESLNLNIWTDNLDSSAKKPVLVFMHGGGLRNGSALELKTYDGKYMAEYSDVVFVSVNARLNYVGYLDLSSIGGDANIGVSDMVLSLEWVRDNIQNFGGDPENVTIIGQSGGGTKVTALASSEEAQGLFQRVVYASGGVANGQSVEEASDNAETFVTYLRENVDELKDASDESVFTYLQNVKYDDLVAFAESAGVSYGLTYGAPYFSENFYHEDGVNEIASQYTYMVGFVWGEMAGMNSADAILAGRPNEAKGNISESSREEIMMTLLDNYYDEASSIFTEIYPNHDLYDLRSLVVFAGSDIAEHLKNSDVEVYEYLVAYEMPYFGGMTMTHTSDIGFWFHSIDSIPYQIKGDEDNAHKVQDTMASALEAFTRDGNPSTSTLEWENYNEENRTMIFDVESGTKLSSFDDRLEEILSLLRS